jgi:hypothetical protein
MCCCQVLLLMQPGSKAVASASRCCRATPASQPGAAAPARLSQQTHLLVAPWASHTHSRCAHGCKPQPTKAAGCFHSSRAADYTLYTGHQDLITPPAAAFASAPHACMLVCTCTFVHPDFSASTVRCRLQLRTPSRALQPTWQPYTRRSNLPLQPQHQLAPGCIMAAAAAEARPAHCSSPCTPHMLLEWLRGAHAARQQAWQPPRPARGAHTKQRQTHTHYATPTHNTRQEAGHGASPSLIAGHAAAAAG